MSSKREEKVAFEKLKKAFPGKNLSFISEYCSWHKHIPSYYCTVNDVGSTCGEDTITANEAVDRMINIRKEEKL